MRLTVIGMWGGFPKKGEPCSGYLLEHDGFSLLLDCGSGVLVKLQEIKDLNNIHDVVLSHYHYDHASDIGSYLYSRFVNSQLKRVKKPLTIYGPNDHEKVEEYTQIPFNRFQKIEEGSLIEIGPFQLSFLKTRHPIETYAVKVEWEGKRLVYTADSEYFKELVDFSKGADLLITECSLYDGMDGSASGHMNAKEAGKLAKGAGAKRTLLTHLPHYGDLEQLVKSAKEEGNTNIELAEAGMSITV